MVSIRDGKLTIAECKDSGHTLNEKEATRLADIANHLNCARLLFVTPTNFPQAESLFPKVQEQCNARVEWWEGRDIFDQSVRERAGMKSEQVDAEEKAKLYLENITTSTPWALSR